jgi:hypothetical protein
MARASNKKKCSTANSYFKISSKNWNFRDFVCTRHSLYKNNVNPSRALHSAWRTGLDKIASCKCKDTERHDRAAALSSEHSEEVCCNLPTQAPWSASPAWVISWALINAGYSPQSNCWTRFATERSHTTTWSSTKVAALLLHRASKL